LEKAAAAAVAAVIVSRPSCTCYICSFAGALRALRAVRWHGVIRLEPRRFDSYVKSRPFDQPFFLLWRKKIQQQAPP